MLLSNHITEAETTLANCASRKDKSLVKAVISCLKLNKLPCREFRQSYTMLVGRLQTQDRYGR